MKSAFVLVLFLASGALFAAESKPSSNQAPAKETKEASGIARDEKDIPVPQPKADVLIADRLTKILTITGWFEGLKVTSQEGVVSLYGKVSEASQRDWAIDLANDADGVVAVVNKVELKELAWFDLTATKQELKSLWKAFFLFIPRLVIGILIFVIAVSLYGVFAKLNRAFWSGRIENRVLSDVVSKLGALPILLVGLYLVLQVWGLTGLAFTLLGGTGALGLVAGFAFKNILENYFSGIMLSLRKPFVVGDQIEVAGEKGIVFKMTTRGTTLVDADGKHVLIPNTTIFTSIIRNKTAGVVTRVSMKFDASTEDLASQKSRLREYLLARTDIVKDPQIDIFSSGTSEKPKLEVHFWVDSKKTNIEKLQHIIRSEFSGAALSEQAPLPGAKDSNSDVQAILARAALTPPAQKPETHL